MIKTKQNTLFVGTLAKGLRILRAFDETHTELTLTELAKITGLEKSSAQRLANTLYLEGMLEKNPTTRRYRPSHAWLQLAYAYYWSNPLVARAMPKLIDLSQRIRETINLAEISNDSIIYSARLPCTRTIYAASVPGRMVPALNTSAGQAIIATFPEEERKAAIRDWHLHPHTAHTTVDRSQIEHQINHVVEAGYAMTSDQMILGEIGIACAIRGPDFRGYAAVHCSVSSHHWDKDKIKAEILPWLLDTANAISPAARQ